MTPREKAIAAVVAEWQAEDALEAAERFAKLAESKARRLVRAAARAEAVPGEMPIAERERATAIRKQGYDAYLAQREGAAS